MTGLMLVSAFAGLGLLLCWAVWTKSLSRRRIQRRVAQADVEISRAHRQAARAMNRAAGQSYRNLIE